MTPELQPPRQRKAGGIWLENLGKDFYFSLRSLRRSLGFSAAVIFTLALCIWANAAVLSVLYGLVLKPLPFPDAGQIVAIYNTRPKAGQMKQMSGVAQYLDYKAQADLFAEVSIWHGWMFNIGEESGTARYIGMRTTPEYFSVLGLRPLLGRFFTAEECRPGNDNVVVLTQSFWETQFRGDPDIVGKEVRLTGRVFTVVGVLPKTYEELSVAPKLMKPYEWTPAQAQPGWRMAPMGNLYARIKPGVAHETALAQLQLLEGRNREKVADPATKQFLASGGHRMNLTQVRAEQTEPIRNGLLLLQGGALFVLLLGCVNVASLMLARANARQAEFAVRMALGASRGGLTRQLLTETTLLALVGSALGLALAFASLRMVNAYAGTIILGIPPVRLDGGVLGMTLLAAAVVALSTGLLPAWRVLAGGGLQNVIQSGMRGASRGSGIRAMGGVLVVMQVALALMLLIGAGLLVRSFAKVMAINPGFDAARVIHARVAYDTPTTEVPKLQALQDRILERMREIPGVESVAYSDRLPGFAEDKLATLPLRGMAPGKDGTHPTAVAFGASPEYLPTMGIRILEGRNFTAADLLPGARPVFVVDRKFADRHFPDRSAVGQLFAFGPPDQKPENAPVIIGVAEVARVSGLERNVEPYVYWPMRTSPAGLSVELRTSRKFEDMMPLIRAQLRKVDPSLPIYQAQTMQMQLDNAAANRRAILWLLSAFAGIAVLLAAIGIYGMLAYDVTQRTREIGIRGAIGATPWQNVSLILRQGLWRTLAGMSAGLAGAFLLSRYMSSLLFEVRPNDPLIFATVAVVLFVVAVVASWLPARRAAKVDPIVALRCE